MLGVCSTCPILVKKNPQCGVPKIMCVKVMGKRGAAVCRAAPKGQDSEPRLE